MRVRGKVKTAAKDGYVLLDCDPENVLLANVAKMEIKYRTA
jgi:hypothetical protein